jgi:hypothetical protein
VVSVLRHIGIHVRGVRKMSLAYKVSTNVAARIWAASYDPKRDAFRVALENGQIFLLQRPIPEDDHSEVLDVYIEGDGEVFTVVQASGNEFSVPWDVIQSLAIGKKRTDKSVFLRNNRIITKTGNPRCSVK